MPNLSLHQTLEKRNAETSQNWQQFAWHRERLTALLEHHRPSQAQTLCVLGAGNCNDLDLPRLLQTFQQITLVDLDEQAMVQAVAQQLPENLLPESLVPRVEIIRLDVTGAFDLLGGFADKAGGISQADLGQLAARLEQQPVADQLERQFDYVLSSCLLSQLIDAIRSVVGEDPRRFVPLVQMLRRQHIETLMRLTAPEGLAALVFDFVSSVTCPTLEHLAEDQLSSLARALVAQGNFFTGLNPAAVLGDFLAPQVSGRLATPPVLTAPWKWNLGPRWYLVAAVLATLR